MDMLTTFFAYGGVMVVGVVLGALAGAYLSRKDQSDSVARGFLVLADKLYKITPADAVPRPPESFATTFPVTKDQGL